MRGAWQWIAATVAVLALSAAGALFLKATVAPRVMEPAVAALAIGTGAGADTAIGTNPVAAAQAPSSVVQ
jgi:hypothetical protein